MTTDEIIQELQNTVNQHTDSISKLSILIERLKQTVQAQDTQIVQLETQLSSLRARTIRFG